MLEGKVVIGHVGRHEFKFLTCAKVCCLKLIRNN